MCEVGKTFANVDFYNKEMAKGIEDKLFFVNKLPKEYCIFVDFGCADGTLINALVNCNNHKFNRYIGYDISETMIDIAKCHYHGPMDAKVSFTSDWEEVKKALWVPFRKKVLILSSVIHEVYSYGNKETIKDFWDKVGDGWDYVVIRDMCLTADDENAGMSAELSDKIQLSRGTAYDEQIIGFVNKWGDLQHKKNALHFLLKYRWRLNWQRELNENYFPITVEEMLQKMQTANYKINYLERFRVPFLDECIYNDIGVVLPEDWFTHVKAIFAKNNKH